MCSQDNPRESLWNFSNPYVANPTNVFLSSSRVNRGSSSCESQSMQFCSFSFDAGSSSTQPAESSGLQSVRKLLQESGVPTNVVNVVMLSRRPSTHKQYSTYIHKWTNFCCQRKVDPLRPTLNNVLEFLQSLFEQGLSYSALCTKRSAISNLDKLRF